MVVIVSFDCGTKKMACVILSIDQSVDFKTETDNKILIREASMSSIQVLQVLTEDIRSANKITQVNNLHKFVQKTIDLTKDFQNVKFIIELQFKNNTLEIQHYIFSYLISQNLKDITLIHAKCKLQVRFQDSDLSTMLQIPAVYQVKPVKPLSFQDVQKLTLAQRKNKIKYNKYKNNKNYTIEQLYIFLKNYQHQLVIPTAYKSDIADALLQGVWFYCHSQK